jgi:hypothetical protein
MSYTKPDQTPFAANLATDEFVVTLDSGQTVAVRCALNVESNTGYAMLTPQARQVDGSGVTVLDANGHPIASEFGCNASPADITLAGSMGAMQKLAIMAVLGEPTAPMWEDPIHTTMLTNASIRTTIASASHAGPVASLGSLL